MLHDEAHQQERAHLTLRFVVLRIYLDEERVEGMKYERERKRDRR